MQISLFWLANIIEKAQTFKSKTVQYPMIFIYEEKAHKFPPAIEGKTAIEYYQTAS